METVIGLVAFAGLVLAAVAVAVLIRVNEILTDTRIRLIKAEAKIDALNRHLWETTGQSL